MTAFLAFFAPWSRYLLIGAAALALAAGVWWWDSARIARHEEAATLACNASHAAAWAKAEADARAAIRASEEAAYLRGVTDAEARAKAAAASAEQAETIIYEVIHDSPSARACVFDSTAADALNRLREP